ncbi:MAG: HAD family phosphatase [Chitinophagaceae bacterium]|nr:HAD family phosphatase [Chitinophagaceae bacterium]
MVQSNIRNIIFDLGGVILDIDFKRTSDAFKALGVQNFDALFSQFHANPLFTDLECGRITKAEFVDTMKGYAGKELTEKQVIDAWNAILIHFPVQRIELLKKLRATHRTFLLSNTNAIHAEKFEKMYRDTVGEGSFEDCFEKIYYSHNIGFRKPNKEAYEVVLNENALKPEETVFIDDTLPNIEAARALGITVVHLQPPVDITDLF